MSKKTLIAILAALMLAAAVFAGCEEVQQSLAISQPAAGTAAAAVPAIPGVNITVDQARKTALDHAGLSEQDVVFVKSWLDVDDGRLVYEVEFYSGAKEYDYDIDAATGAILSMDQDIEGDFPALQALAAGNQPGITEEQARQAALAHAGLNESDVVFARTGLDFDDGRLIYEVEFYSGVQEYDYDIDARTGAVLSFDQEFDYDLSALIGAQAAAPAPAAAAAPAAPAAPAGPITQDQALQIALQHAGVTQNQISRLKVKQDYDDGFQKYEIEFHVGRTEYEYDIDVNSGRILSFDKDND